MPDSLTVNPLFAESAEELTVPRFALPAGSMAPHTAYQLVHDEAMLDGNARLNLATFVTTWMEPAADQLYRETFDKNMIDKDEYPATAAIEARCVTMLADLWHAPEPRATIGTSTVGSSEACMLGGLALKRRWQLARRAAGAAAERPNLVMSSAVQVVWEKFANYWDVEPRYVPVTDEHPLLDGADIGHYVDENTIGVVAILGQTYTGAYEPVARIAAALDQLQADTGLDVPIHVDGASGGFVAPFLDPDLVWDFRLPRVASISTSGHKYGLVYPGIGWVVWRAAERLPEELIFKVSYLGGEMPTLAINFSRPGAQVLLQYYNFLRLGFDGYRRVQQACRDIAKHLSGAIGAMDEFEVVADGSELPVVAWKLAGATANPGGRWWDLHDLSNQLRERGWQVPAYPLPDDMAGTTVQRVVVRNGVSRDLADHLLDNIRSSVEYLRGLSAPLPRAGRQETAYHH
ncbi:MAG: glutamate decarboxylase [Actinomycetia bacterium]|nr:glutamate decarboxylase [Actinomycetes bacterium]